MQENLYQKPLPVLLLTGATGSGKSSLIYSLPKNLPLVIIGCDSRQVYQDIPVITAQPNKAEMTQFEHHLINFLPLEKSYSAGGFANDAKKLIQNTHAKKKLPIIVGGTFFYIRSLWDGVPPDITIPEPIKKNVSTLSNEEKFKQLEKIDIASAKKISINDTYRLQRALEYNLTILETSTEDKSSEKTLYSHRRNKGGIWNKYHWTPFVVSINRENLYQQINARTESMFQTGALEEINAIFTKNKNLDIPSLKTIGIREIQTLLQANDSQWDFFLKSKSISPHTLQKIVEMVSMNTRRFAKRQLTWFRQEQRLKRFDPHVQISLLSNAVDAALEAMI